MHTHTRTLSLGRLALHAMAQEFVRILFLRIFCRIGEQENTLLRPDASQAFSYNLKKKKEQENESKKKKIKLFKLNVQPYERDERVCA